MLQTLRLIVQFVRGLFSDGFDFATKTKLAFSIPPPKDDPNKIEINPIPPPVVLESFALDGTTANIPPSEIVVPPDVQNLEIAKQHRPAISGCQIKMNQHQ